MELNGKPEFCWHHISNIFCCSSTAGRAHRWAAALRCSSSLRPADMAVAFEAVDVERTAAKRDVHLTHTTK